LVKKVIVAYSGDINYFPHIGVSLTSLSRFNKLDRVFLLTDTSSKEKSTELSEYAKELGVELDILEVDISSYNLKTSKKISLAAYYRILLPKLLSDIDKVIYLDGDTIILNSLEYIWNIDIGGNVIAAVEDGSINKAVKIKIFGKEKAYFNDGVLIMDLSYFRENNLTELMLEFAQDYKEKITYHDQCVLNYFLQEKWIKLPAQYNLMAFHLLNPEKYSAEISAPVVVHYNSYYGKPWDYYCIHPMKDLYLEVREHTPWKSCQLTNKDWLSYYRRKFAIIDKTLVHLREIVNRIG
jgi:lipopolysaccharide biosynthesis glycosyltransferase